MSVPSDKIMSLIQGAKGAGTPAPDAGAPADATAPPMGAPMSTPEPKMGNKEGAMINLSMALDLIEQALPALGSESPEGQKAMAALRSISSLLGPRKGKAQELQQSEILQMLQNLPQAGGATPEGAAMAAAPAVPNMGGTPPPPAVPPAGAGAPPPMTPPAPM